MVNAAEGDCLVTPEMVAQFKSQDEHVMFSERTHKVHTTGRTQEDRIYIQTTDNLYTFKVGRDGAYTKTRFYQIKNVGAIILSNENENDFMLFFYNSEDLILHSNRREELLNLLTLRYFTFNRNITLRIYSVSNNDLIKYLVNNNAQQKMKKVFDLPDDSTRLLEQEIKGEDEYNAEIRSGRDGHIDDLPFDMTSTQGMEQSEMAEGKVNKKVTGHAAVHGDAADDADFGEEFANSRESVLVGFRTNSNIRFEDFVKKALLGRGTFGKVFLAVLPSEGTGKQYAIKAIRKDVLIEYKQVQNTKLEKDILFSCDHPFLVGMEYLFQNDTRLYFVMPFIKGGELYKIFKAHKRLPEPVVKFYALQIALAIGYLHSKGIMHRDLKLENILVDESGYLKIIDYGLAKTLPESNLTRTFCGTPEYLAPEMVTQQGHNFSVDWWALGILIYEMLIGVTPFYNKERRLLLLKIRQSRVVFPDKRKYKIDYSDEFVDIVQKLLDKDKETRLGTATDFDEIVNHPFFADIDKEALLRRELEPPLRMTGERNEFGFDPRVFNMKNTQADLAESVLPQAKLDTLNKNKNAFADFEKQGANLARPGKVHVAAPAKRM